MRESKREGQRERNRENELTNVLLKTSNTAVSYPSQPFCAVAVSNTGGHHVNIYRHESIPAVVIQICLLNKKEIKNNFSEVIEPNACFAAVRKIIVVHQHFSFQTAIFAYSMYIFNIISCIFYA